ncbi:hypothetical protein TNCV_3370611 [Trichonephila clavipes]|nr:hypothetical protein TNCV_3370611 [Trichonephila clavipes]
MRRHSSQELDFRKRVKALIVDARRHLPPERLSIYESFPNGKLKDLIHFPLTESKKLKRSFENVISVNLI